MRELLHIPSGKIIRFDHGGYEVSLAIHVASVQRHNPYCSNEAIIDAIACGDFSTVFYKRHNLPEPPFLNTEFEVIEI